MADLLQIQSQLADAENDVLTARNNYDISRLNLCQLLEIDDYTSFRTAAPDVSELVRNGMADEPAAILDAAQSLPEVESARVGIDLARRSLQIARAAYWPTISLSAGYGSSYSDARQKMFQNADGTYRYEAYPFFEQYKDNASSYVSLSLNIPIFGKLTTRKNVLRQKTGYPAGGICIANRRETGSQRGYAGADRCPHGMGTLSWNATLCCIGRRSGPAGRPQIRPRRSLRDRLQRRTHGRRQGPVAAPAGTVRISVQMADARILPK